MPQDRIAALFDTYAQDVLAYALRRTDRATAEDVVSEVFAVAWRRADRVPQTEPLLWLYSVARRVLANERRGQRRRAALSVVLRTNGRRRDDEPFRPELLRALAALPQADREILMLTAWEGLSVREAAAVLGCRTEAAHTRLHRARRRLGVALGREDLSPGGSHDAPGVAST